MYNVLSLFGFSFGFVLGLLLLRFPLLLFQGRCHFRIVGSDISIILLLLSCRIFFIALIFRQPVQLTGMQGCHTYLFVS
jgi:hypothetical protein